MKLVKFHTTSIRRLGKKPTSIMDRAIKATGLEKPIYIK